MAARSPRHLFEQHCGACHNTTEANNVGPHLAGILGRPIGSLDDFAYSQAFSNVDGVWTRDGLAAYIRDPNGVIAGAKMPATDVSPEESREIVDYLASPSDL